MNNPLIYKQLFNKYFVRLFDSFAVKEITDFKSPTLINSNLKCFGALTFNILINMQSVVFGTLQKYKKGLKIVHL